jgi:hypothetical protein
VEDVCIAVRDRFGLDLAARRSRAATPCVVEIALPARDAARAVATAAWYVEAALRGEETTNAHWGYDGRGQAIGPEHVISVRAADGTEREWSPHARHPTTPG